MNATSSARGPGLVPSVKSFPTISAVSFTALWPLSDAADNTVITNDVPSAFADLTFPVAVPKKPCAAGGFSPQPAAPMANAKTAATHDSFRIKYIPIHATNSTHPNSRLSHPPLSKPSIASFFGSLVSWGRTIPWPHPHRLPPSWHEPPSAVAPHRRRSRFLTPPARRMATRNPR